MSITFYIKYFITLVINSIQYMFEKIKKFFKREKKAEIEPLSREERERIAQLRVEKYKDDPILAKIKAKHKQQDLEEKREMEYKNKNLKNTGNSNVDPNDWLS